MVRGNLPLQFALSKRRGVFEERDVDAGYPIALGGIGHFLDDHLPNEWDGNAFDTVHHLIRTPHGGTLEIGAVRHVHRRWMLARFGDELLESQRDKVGHPMLQAFDRFRRRLCGPAFKLAANVEQQALKAIQAVLYGRQPLRNIFHNNPLPGLFSC
jgi:hypothetical protein